MGPPHQTPLPEAFGGVGKAKVFKPGTAMFTFARLCRALPIQPLTRHDVPGVESKSRDRELRCLS